MLLLIQAALLLSGCIAACKYAQRRSRRRRNYKLSPIGRCHEEDPPSRASEGADAPLGTPAQACDDHIDCLGPVSMQSMHVGVNHPELQHGPREETGALTSIETDSSDPSGGTVGALAPEIPLHSTDQKQAGDNTGCNEGTYHIKFRGVEAALEMAPFKVLLSELREKVTKQEAHLLACKAGQTNEIFQRGDVSRMDKQLRQQDEAIRSLTVQASSLETQLGTLRQELSWTDSLQKDLGFAHVRIKALKDEIMSGTSHTKEQLLLLKEHFGKLQCDVNHVGHMSKDIGIEQSVHKATRELEAEISELRGFNKTLFSEIQEFTEKVAAAQGRDAEIAPGRQSDGMAAEGVTSELRSINRRLTKKVEELQLGRFIEIEELVYLRWVNACLHHDLDLYKGSSRKSVSTSVASDDEDNSSNYTEEYCHVPRSTTSYVSSPSAVEVASTSPHSHDRYYSLNHPLSLEIQHSSRTSINENSGKGTYQGTRLSSDLSSDTKHMKRSPIGQPRFLKQFVRSVSNLSPDAEGSSKRSKSKSNTLAVDKQRRHSSSLLDEYLQHRHRSTTGSGSNDDRIQSSKKARLRLSSSLPYRERWPEIEGAPDADISTSRRTGLHGKARLSESKSNVGHSRSLSSSSSSRPSGVAVSFQLLSLASRANNKHHPAFKDLATHNQPDIDGVSKIENSLKYESPNTNMASTGFEPIEKVFATKPDFPETSAFTAWQEKYVPQTIVQQ